MRIQDAWQTNDDVRRIATNAGIIEILERLYGRPAFPFQTLNFPVGTQQHFHTDSIHFSSRPERFMCGVWVALDDIGPDNGPLVYYPGSHRWPIYTREHIGVSFSRQEGGHQGTFEPLWQRLVELHKIEPQYFYAKKGQALIWAANLIHGGAFHKDRSKTRWSQVTHYYFKDCVYYTPLTSNEPAGDIFVRNPQDIRTRGVMRSSYHGAPIDMPTIAPPAASAPANIPADFDPERYMALNPDVAAGEMDARTHYVRYGRTEGRRFK